MIRWVCHDAAAREKFLRYNIAAPCLALYGYFDVLRWLYKTGTNDLVANTGVMRYAARGGHVKIIYWLRQHGCLWNEMVCAEAAKGGHFRLLRWLVKRGCPWDEMTCAHAAEGGYLEIIKWSVANGAKPTSCISIYAAIYGNIDVLKWAFDNRNIVTHNGNSIWTDLVFTHAAESGRLAVLQWGYEKGLCVYGGDILIAAARKGQLHILEWMHNWYVSRPEKEHPAYEWARTACINAIYEQHLEVLEWCLKQGYPVGYDLCEKTHSFGSQIDDIHHIYTKFDVRCETCRI